MTFTMEARPCALAVMSKKTISSAPWSLYRRASSTGSPTLRSSPASALPNCTPRVTLPSWTSRQGMTRLASMVRGTRLFAEQMLDHHLVEILVIPRRDQFGRALLVKGTGLGQQLHEGAAAVVQMSQPMFRLGSAEGM